MTYPHPLTDEQRDAAIGLLSAVIDAAESGNYDGEEALWTAFRAIKPATADDMRPAATDDAADAADRAADVARAAAARAARAAYAASAAATTAEAAAKTARVAAAAARDVHVTPADSAS